MELIQNGNFDDGELAPWSPCSGMTLQGGVTDMQQSPVFCSQHNLKLLGNDCVQQQLTRVAVASEGLLTLWVRLWPDGPFEHMSSADAGRFEASVQYSVGGDSATSLLDLDTLRARGVPVVLGGVHASNVPEEAMSHADSRSNLEAKVNFGG